MSTSTTSGFAEFRSQTSSTSLETKNTLKYSQTISNLRNTFNSGRTKDIKWRKQQLKQLKNLVLENTDVITQAVMADLGGPKFRAVLDMLIVPEIDLFLKFIDDWASPTVVKHDSFLGRSYVRKEPKGVMLLIAPWNYPFAMVFDPLAAMIAAGNCAVIKPSEVSVNACKVIADLIPKYLDTDAFAVVTGGVPETTALLKEKFDHIMYTGNGHVGRIVMTAAAKTITPVTLELGGKSPVYVDKSAKLGMTIARVAVFKWMNGGQTCIAPDYILVHEDVAEEFKKLLLEAVEKYYGKTVSERMNNKDLSQIIHSRHVERLAKLIDKTTGEITVGGNFDAEQRAFEPTVVLEPSLKDSVMKEEIFGPILPVITVKNAEEAIEKLKQVAPDPLALYVFAEDQGVIDKILDNTSSGGVCINAVMEQFTQKELPFGGIGSSGFGHYHGKWGFDEFSHFRAVYVKDSTFNKAPGLPPPPYADNFYDLVLKFSVTGFLTEKQKFALKVGTAAVGAVLGYKIIRSRL